MKDMFASLHTLILGAIFVLIWSSGWIGSKYALNYASAFSFLAWRYILVVATLLIVITVFRQWRIMNKFEWARQASAGLLSHTAYLSLSVAAIESGVGAGMVAFITAMQPVFTLGLAYSILYERLNLQQLLGIVLGVVSVVLVIGAKISLGGSMLTYSLPLLAVLSLTLASILCRCCDNIESKRANSATPLPMVMLVQTSTAMIGFCALAYCFGGFAIKIETGLYYVMAYMVLVVSIGSYGLYFFLLRRLSAVKVASFVYLTPPVTMIFGWLWFKEALSASDFAGLFLALIAVILVTRSDSNQHSAIRSGQASNKRFNYLKWLSKRWQWRRPVASQSDTFFMSSEWIRKNGHQKRLLRCQLKARNYQAQRNRYSARRIA